ncbi:hypothetical protein [Cronobacter turicensis]|uniref:hypothetical protein n=1 Tax=Cronobacter turicensis TaxID=413502 RepID=UPI001412D898|nr:hypothetical protein [Cronobacter turicensis]
MQRRNKALIFSFVLRINPNKEIVNQATDKKNIVTQAALLAAKGKARCRITRQRAQKRRGKKGKRMKS